MSLTEFLVCDAENTSLLLASSLHCILSCNYIESISAHRNSFLLSPSFLPLPPYLFLTLNLLLKFPLNIFHLSALAPITEFDTSRKLHSSEPILQQKHNLLSSQSSIPFLPSLYSLYPIVLQFPSVSQNQNTTLSQRSRDSSPNTPSPPRASAYTEIIT